MIEGRGAGSWGLPLIVGGLSLVLLFLAMPRDLNIFDEGIILSGAMRVLDGDLIHRDFYSSYGPAQYYIVAGLFRLFEDHFLAARVYDLTIRAAIAAVLFAILRPRTGRSLALASSGVCVLWFIAAGNYLYPIYPCILLALVGSYLLVDIGRRPPVSLATFAAGACAGLAALFRYDAGFFLLVANVAALVTLIGVERPRGRRLGHGLAAVVTYGAGTALVFLPPAISFLLSSPLQAFYADIVDYSVKYYAEMRGLPFPGFQALRAQTSSAAIYLPPLAAFLAAAELLRRMVRRRRPESRLNEEDAWATAYLVLFGSLAAILFLKGVVRVSTLHMLLAIVPSLVVCAVLVRCWWSRGFAMRLGAVALVLFVTGPPAVLAKYELGRDMADPARSMGGWIAMRTGLARPIGQVEACELGPASTFARLGEDHARAATYANTYSKPGEPILAALSRHDRIYMNSVSIYFAADRLPGTHWHQFDPGLQTRADIQTAIVEDLQRNHVRWVVRDGSFDSIREPNGSALSSGVRILDRHLDENYRPVARFGKVAMWLRNGETPVANGPPPPCARPPAG